MSDGARSVVRDRLNHMIEAADAITGYVARGRAAFDTDPAVRDAILYRLIVLGEAAKAPLVADPTLATTLPDVNWSPMARCATASRTTTGRRIARSSGRPPPTRCPGSGRLSLLR